ncbi:MAG: flagellar basal body P-ring formation chaperone FlgA [candidate division Zixibacteria bacterium]|nr:flagellar basal body P-ring formation chaperone FlgA [candidate division Zixibacteria bacterium]
MSSKYVTICLILGLLLLFGTSVGAATCEQAIIDNLVDMYQLDTSNFKLEILTCQLKTTDVDPADVSVRALTQKRPLGLFSVIVKINQDGKLVESGQVRLKIRKFADVLVTTDKIRSEDTFSDKDVVLRKMDVTSLRERPLNSIAVLEGHRARRYLRKGTILTTESIEIIPDIEYGREVSIVYKDGLCRVSTPGEAMGTGMAGDYMKVRNKASRKIIEARVIDASTVIVDP